MSKALSRRGFIVGSGLTGLGLVGGFVAPSAASLGAPRRAYADAASNAQSSSAQADAVVQGEGPNPIIPSSATDTSYGTYLNPQEDFSQYTTDYSDLFQPLQIGTRTMKNRLGKSAASSEMQHDPNWPDETDMGFYEQFAKGGCGMVCYEYSNFIPRTGKWGGNTYPEGPGGQHWLDISTDAGIPAHKAVTDRLHQYDTLVLAQMWDLCMSTGGGGSAAPVTKLELSFNPGIVQSTEDVQQEIQFFIDGAERYKKAGFDGIELNASCNHYFSTFLSRTSNHERTDQYSGDSVENRARVLTEIIEGVRARVGKDFIIQVLYSGVEGNVDDLSDESLCTTVEEACEFAKLFEAAGADSLHIRSQMYGNHAAGFMQDMPHYFEHGDYGYGSVVDYNKHMGGAIRGQNDGVGGLLDVAARIKECVSIPVGVVGSCDPRLAPDIMDHAVRDGKVDFLLMTRPLLADTHLPEKLKANRRDEVAPCTHCMTCFAAPYDVGRAPMYCRVNAAMTNAFSTDMPEGYDPLQAGGHESVMVVGAGPGGMECARIAAQRGYKVTLYEKTSDVGGLMNLAKEVKGTHERIEDHKRYLLRSLQMSGVTLVKNKEVDIDFIRSEAPDIVIVAVGGTFAEVPFESSDRVITTEDFYNGDASIDLPDADSVVIYGAQQQACDLAVHWVKMGKKITMLNPGPQSERFLNAPTWPRMMGREYLPSKGVKIFDNVQVDYAADGSIEFTTEYGVTQTASYDALVCAIPLEANRSLLDAISEIQVTKTVSGNETTFTPEAYAVGDAYSPSTIVHATARGNIVARQLGQDSGEQDAPLTEGQYRGKAIGFGDVSVTIDVSGSTITAAKVNTSHETAGVGREYGEQFAQEIVEKGTIDTVSGATLTSNAVIEALAAAKQSAGL